METFIKSLQYYFTEGELLEKGRQIAAATAEIARLEAEAKSVASKYKGEIGGVEDTVRVLAGEIGTGYTHQDVECYWRYHTPIAGVKQCVRADLNIVVHEAAMTIQESQEYLFSPANPNDEGDQLPPEKPETGA